MFPACGSSRTFCSCPSHDRTVMPDQASVLPVENIIRKVENSASGISDEKETEVSDTLSGPIHYLVVGTFATEEEADRFIAMRQDCGYELESVGGKRLWRVSAVKDSDRKKSCQYSEFQKNSARLSRKRGSGVNNTC